MRFEYQTPLDRGYYSAGNFWPDESPKLEEPVIPIKEIGTTIVEKDPRTGANIVQNAQAAIRAGTGNMQIVMTTPSTAAIGGRPKAYGKEVREALKEITKANEVVISGIEMPTSSISNLSGFNPQTGNMSEEKRQQDMEEVRDAIKFAADVAGGGGVDIWSQEFPRSIFDARWNRTDKKWKENFEAYPEEEKHAVKHLVDTRDGRIIQEIRMSQKISQPQWLQAEKSYVDNNGNKIKKDDFVDYDGNKITMDKRVPKYNEETNRFEIREVGWEYFKDEAKKMNDEMRENAKKEGKSVDPKKLVTPEQAFLKGTLQAQIGIAEGYADYYNRNTDDLFEQRNAIKGQLKIKNVEDRQPIRLARDTYLTDEDLNNENLRLRLNEMDKLIEQNKELSVSQLMQAEDLRRRMDYIETAEEYAKKKAIESYAELGVFAMDESKARNTVKPLYVGPELGWPQQWGGHPEEFTELIKSARKEMVNRLTQPKVQGGREMGRKEAEKLSEKHVKGLLDTGHMGMWLNHFKRKEGESEDRRLKRFEKWYLDQTEKLAKEGVVGSVYLPFLFLQILLIQ